MVKRKWRFGQRLSARAAGAEAHAGPDRRAPRPQGRRPRGDDDARQGGGQLPRRPDQGRQDQGQLLAATLDAVAAEAASIRPRIRLCSSPRARAAWALPSCARRSWRRRRYEADHRQPRYSSWSMRGWLACQQSGLEFEELVVPMFDEDWEKRREGDEFAPSLGKVPILWDGDCVVWDSLAIVDFLADRVGPENFWPEDEAARGMARSMAAEMHLGFANLRRELPMNVRKSFRSRRLSDERRGRDRAHPQFVGAGARALRRLGRISVRRLVRRRHHVRPRSSPASSPMASGSRRSPPSTWRRRPPPRRRRRMDRACPGRTVGDRAI